MLEKFYSRSQGRYQKNLMAIKMRMAKEQYLNKIEET